MDSNNGTTTETTRTVQRGPAPDRAQLRDHRPTEITSYRHGPAQDGDAEPNGGSGRGAIERLRTDGAAPRSFTEHQRQMLAAMDGPAPASAAAAPAAGPAPSGGLNAAAKSEPAPAAPVEAAKAPSPAVEPPNPDAGAERAAELAKHNERLTEVNRKLVARLEQAERRSSAPLDERMTALLEIEHTWTTDPYTAMRKLTALNAGIKDHASPDVDALLSNIYTEWTGKELKMQPDPARQALIEAQRNRILMARDKREREAADKAAQDAKMSEAERTKHAEIARGIDSRLEAEKHADKYPLLMKYAKVIDQTSPGDLIWNSIRRDIAAGVMDPNTPDDVLINHYSKQIETHYQAHRDALSVAPASTSTAPTTQATVPVADKPADATQPGVRTITNASASVAPAALPTATTPPAPDKPRKMSEEARRLALAAKHFPST